MLIVALNERISSYALCSSAANCYIGGLMEPVKIIISGSKLSGKTTLAHIIYTALCGYDLDIELIDDNEIIIELRAKDELKDISFDHQKLIIKTEERHVVTI